MRSLAGRVRPIASLPLGPLHHRTIRGGEPLATRPDRHDHCTLPGVRGQHLGLLGGIHDHDVRGAQGAPVDDVEDAQLRPAPQIAIADGVREADEMVQGDHRPPVAQPRQVHVGVAHVPDQHDVRVRTPSRAPDQAGPRSRLPAGQPQRRRRRPSCRHLVRGCRAQWLIELLDQPAAGGQPVTQHGHAWVQGGVVGPEDEQSPAIAAHDPPPRHRVHRPCMCHGFGPSRGPNPPHIERAPTGPGAVDRFSRMGGAHGAIERGREPAAPVRFGR